MMAATLRWEVENTGGGCMAFEAHRDGFKYLITCKDDPSLPDPTEAAALGIYMESDDSDAVYFADDFQNSLAAARYAQSWTPPDVRSWLTKHNYSRWHSVFAPDAHRRDLLSCPVASVCGEKITRCIASAECLLGEVSEYHPRTLIVDAVREYCNVVYFG